MFIATLNGATFTFPADPCVIGDGTHFAELHVHNSTVSTAGSTVTIAADAVLDGGSSTSQDVGIATFSNSNLSFSGSTSVLHLSIGGSPTAGNAGTTYDQIDISNGVFTVGGATLQIVPLAGTVLNQPYPVVVVGAGGSINYSQIFSNLATDPSSSYASARYAVLYSSTEIDVVFNAVPEPTPFWLGSVAMASAILPRRRRQISTDA